MRTAASWRKRLDARLPPLGSRVRVSVTPCRFSGGRNEVWVGFSRGFSRIPLPQISFHHFSTPISSILFISSAFVMVRQAWSAGTLATHGPIILGLHRISSLDPTLCWTRVEDILFKWSTLLLRCWYWWIRTEPISRWIVARLSKLSLLSYLGYSFQVSGSFWE